MTKTSQPIAKKSSPKKTVKASTVAPIKAQSPAIKSGRLKLATYRERRDRHRAEHPRLAAVWKLSQTAAQTLWEHRVLFIGITLVYGLLNLILVRGFANGTDVGSLKTQLGQLFNGNFGSLASSPDHFRSTSWVGRQRIEQHGGGLPGAIGHRGQSGHHLGAAAGLVGCPTADP